jgi:hypothetical protein
MNNQPEEELVDSRVLRDSLSPEGRAQVDQLVAQAKPRLEFAGKLRRSLNLSDVEYAALLIEHGGSSNDLPIMAVFDNVTSRGGRIEVNIVFD